MPGAEGTALPPLPHWVVKGMFPWAFEEEEKPPPFEVLRRGREGREGVEL